MSESKVCFVAEFDDNSHQNCRVELVQDGTLVSVWVESDGYRHLLLSTCRDQWGVFIDFSGGLQIDQEDKTRSFLDAVCQAIQHVRKLSEITEPATVKAVADQLTNDSEPVQ